MGTATVHARSMLSRSIRCSHRRLVLHRRLHVRPSLDDVAHLGLLQNETSHRIIDIWRKYHTTHKDAVSAVMPADKYQKFQARARDCPLFVLPIARGEGFQTLVLQH